MLPVLKRNMAIPNPTPNPHPNPHPHPNPNPNPNQVNNLGPRVAARDFEPGFMIEHMAKDLGIAVSEAERLGLELPGLANARRLYDALLAAGHGRDGTQALVLALDSPTNPAVSPCR